MRARSAAEIPVLTPSAASIDTVKLVLNFASLRSDISGSASCWQSGGDDASASAKFVGYMVTYSGNGRR